MTLKDRAVKSGGAVVLANIFSQFLRLAGNLALTRLLAPEMFGVMAVVSVIMVCLSMLSDVGLLQSVIRSDRGDEPDFLNTAWSIQIIRGVLLFSITVLLSGALYFFGSMGVVAADTVYGDPILPFVLIAMSVTVIISGFNSINLMLLNRRLMLGKLVLIELVSQVVGLVCMLVWAWYKQDIWALVFGVVVASLFKMILSHIFCGDRCKLCWDSSAASEIFNFGKWIFVSSILGLMINEGDRLLLGGLVTAEVLGVYSVAFFLSLAVKNTLQQLISSVFFPVLSEVVRNDSSNLEAVYYNIKTKIDIISMFSSGFIFSTATFIVSTLYDDRYVDAGWMLQLLSISLIGTGSLLASQCFMSLGKPKLEYVLVLSLLLYFYPAMFLLYHYFDISGAVLAVATYPLVRILVSMYLMRRYVFFDFKKEIFMLPIVLVGFFVGEFFLVTIEFIGFVK